MWLAYALLAPFFWSAVHVLDEHCVDNLFEKPWVGVITSAAASCMIYLLLPFAIPFFNFEGFTLQLALSAFLAGILIQTSQYFYFSSLAQSEAGIVSAYWNMIPALLSIFAYFILNQILTHQQYLGIAILIVCSTLMCLMDNHKAARKRTLVLMVVSSILQIVAYLIMENAYHHMHFLITFYCVVSGLIFIGLTPILFKPVRSELVKNIAKIRKSARLFLFIEGLNLIALCMAQMAIMLSHASLVAAAETTVPMFTFILSYFWLAFTHQSTEDVLHRFNAKLVIALGMVIGVLLL